jgi:hypothetical protein
MACPMPLTTCPECGQDTLRQTTPGFYRCDGQRQVGWNEGPPHVTGAGYQRTPVYGPCDTSFQVGAARSSSPCALCGRDSIGTCQGECGRRLCGSPGWSGIASGILPDGLSAVRLVPISSAHPESRPGRALLKAWRRDDHRWSSADRASRRHSRGSDPRRGQGVAVRRQRRRASSTRSTSTSCRPRPAIRTSRW